MEKKEKAKYIIVGVLFFCLVFLGMYKLLMHTQEKETERQELEFEAIIKKQIAVNELVKEYLQSYTSEIQKQMQEAGIPDIRVVWSEYPVEDYARDFRINKYEYADYSYYIVMEYYSDSIDEFYNEKTKDGNYEEIEDIINELRLITDNAEEDYELKMDEEIIKIHLKNKHIWNTVRIKKDENHYYDLDQWGQHFEVRIDGELVYETPPKPVEKKPSIDKSYSKKYPDDPYDVYDYSDPEDFYYDNWDDFYEYEEAEDYYNEAWDEIE